MRKQLTTAASALLLAAIALPASADDDRRPAFASKTRLTAEEEVQSAPVESAGLGNAIIRFSPGFRRATVKATFSALEGDVTRLHLHCNVAGQNGPIAIGLVDLVAIAQDNSETVTLGANTITGTIRNRQFPEGDPCTGAIGRSVANLYDLAQAIDDGQIYWNLHTTAFPAGELRGQVQPLERVRGRRDD